MPELPTADDEMLPEYDFIGGVRGKHYQAMREGYTAKINQADGTTLIRQFRAEGSPIHLNAQDKETNDGCQGH